MKIFIDADACPVVRIVEDIAKKERRSKSQSHMKGPRKRTVEDDLRFTESFEKMVRKALDIVD